MKALRAGLCLLFTFCVLAHGAVEVWSESLLEIGAASLLLLWAVVVFRKPEGKVYWSILNWPLLGFLAIGFLQLLFHATAYAFLTRVELLKLAAYFIVFFLAAQAFRERRDLKNLVWFLMSLGFAVSLFGIAQHFTSATKLYWIRELRAGGDPFGPYVNRNHFAGFVELVAPFALALLVFRGLRRDQFPLGVLLAIVPIGALILSGSRGGIVSFGFELAVLALLARIRRGTEHLRLTGVAIVGLAAVSLVVWLGVGKAIQRFSTVHQGEVSHERRISMSRSAAHIFLDHPIWGSGLGTLVAVYPRYETAYDGKVVDHAHNDYVETLADTGLLGGLFVGVFLVVLFREVRAVFLAEQGHFSRALHAGAIAGLCGILLHSFVDFNLHIPSNALLFLLSACLATSQALPSEAATRLRSS